MTDDSIDTNSAETETAKAPSAPTRPAARPVPLFSPGRVATIAVG